MILNHSEKLNNFGPEMRQITQTCLEKFHTAYTTYSTKELIAVPASISNTEDYVQGYKAGSCTALLIMTRITPQTIDLHMDFTAGGVYTPARNPPIYRISTLSPQLDDTPNGQPWTLNEYMSLKGRQFAVLDTICRIDGQFVTRETSSSEWLKMNMTFTFAGDQLRVTAQIELQPPANELTKIIKTEYFTANGNHFLNNDNDEAVYCIKNQSDLRTQILTNYQKVKDGHLAYFQTLTTQLCDYVLKLFCQNLNKYAERPVTPIRYKTTDPEIVPSQTEHTTRNPSQQSTNSWTT